MSRLTRARVWLGAAGVGAVVAALSAVALLRSCHAPAHAACLTARVDPRVAQLRADCLSHYARTLR